MRAHSTDAHAPVTSPIAPASSISRALSAETLYRFWKQIPIFTPRWPASSAAATIRSPSASVCASGFSWITCTPASRAWIVGSACALCGVVMCTTSGLTSRSIVPRSVYAGAPVIRAACSRALASVSHTATSSASSMAAMDSKWMVATSPHPTTAALTGAGPSGSGEGAETGAAPSSIIDHRHSMPRSSRIPVRAVKASVHRSGPHRPPKASKSPR